MVGSSSYKKGDEDGETRDKFGACHYSQGCRWNVEQ